MVAVIDVHAHLDFPVLYDRIDEIKESVKDMIVISNGTSFKSNETVLKLSDGKIKAALGLYPVDMVGIDETLKQIENNLKMKGSHVIAIGEVGLDFYNGGKNASDKEKQHLVFRKIIALSKRYNKPMLIHSRKAEKEVFEILEEMEVKKELIVMHCFGGKKKLIERGAKNGWHFTVPTNVVRNEAFQWLVRHVDINHLFCETDSPYLSPFGREEVNEPKNVIESYKMIAKIKKMDLEEVKNNIFMNYQRVFC